jgi:hypothetical protein
MPYTLLNAMKLFGSTVVRSSRNTISIMGSFPVAGNDTSLQEAGEQEQQQAGHGSKQVSEVPMYSSWVDPWQRVMFVWSVPFCDKHMQSTDKQVICTVGLRTGTARCSSSLLQVGDPLQGPPT